MSCPVSATLYPGNNNVVELKALTNSATGVADESASVGATVLDDEGNEVAGQVWPAAMTHIGDGTYRATLEADIELVVGDNYTVLVEATGSGGEAGEWQIPVKARVRNA